MIEDDWVSGLLSLRELSWECKQTIVQHTRCGEVSGSTYRVVRREATKLLGDKRVLQVAYDARGCPFLRETPYKQGTHPATQSHLA